MKKIKIVHCNNQKKTSNLLLKISIINSNNYYNNNKALATLNRVNFYLQLKQFLNIKKLFYYFS